jgi:hypothetical protein
MGVTFAGEECIEPGRLYRQCLDLGLSVEWFGLPNAFTCALGIAPGEGWVLLTRRSLRTISPDLTFSDLCDLEFQAGVIEGPAPAPVTLRNLVVLGADCVTPGVRSQDEAAYLVRLADRRHLVGRKVVDVGYNVRHHFHSGPAGTTQVPADLHWNWQDAAQDLYQQVIGAWPGLPAGTTIPAVPPQDLEFWQTPALQAVGFLLERLGCELQYDPTADSFGIVRPGADDAGFTAALARWDRWRHWDAEPMFSVRGSVPEKVRVLFRRRGHIRGDGSPWLAVDQADPGVGPTTSGYEPGTFALVTDDLVAEYDAHGTLVNNLELQARAAERAVDFYRQVWSVTQRSRLVYPFALVDAGLMPGPQVRSIRWADTATGLDPARGMVTEVTRMGIVPRPAWPRIELDPLTAVVRITGGGMGNLLEGIRQNYDPNLDAWVDSGVPIWVRDANA